MPLLFISYFVTPAVLAAEPVNATEVLLTFKGGKKCLDWHRERSATLHDKVMLTIKKLIRLSAWMVFIHGCGSANIKSEQFDIEMVSISEEGKTRHVRYNIYTGETWWSSNTKWVKIKENTELPISKYKVTIVSTGNSWRTLRIDKISGKTWKNSGGTWLEFSEEQ